MTARQWINKFPEEYDLVINQCGWELDDEYNSNIPHKGFSECQHLLDNEEIITELQVKHLSDLKHTTPYIPERESTIGLKRNLRIINIKNKNTHLKEKIITELIKRGENYE